MNFQFITQTIENSVSTITINRPDVLNSFNREMAKELHLALKQCSLEPMVRAVVLTGAGRAFCAGQDLASVTSNDHAAPSLGEIVRECYNPIILTIRRLEKPVVCAVNGVAAGAGANLAFACDFVLASKSASFIQSFCKVGLIPDSGGTFFLPRLVGMARATALTMLGDKVSADEAVNLGLIYRAVEAEKLMDEVTALATHLAQQPTRGLGLIKRGFNASFSNDLEAQLRYEGQLQDEAGQTSDYAEGVKAFLEKRKPAFKGV